MHNVKVEVLNEAGEVITHCTNMAAVELVRNIQENGTMRVHCEHGVYEINCDRNRNDNELCVVVKERLKHIGYLFPESFVKIYMLTK